MKRFSTLFAGLTILAVVVSTYGHVFAQSNGLGITPRKDYSVKAGESVKDTVYVSNLSKDQPLNLSIRIVDFKAQDESGSPTLERDKNAPPTPWSAKNFISVPEKLTIEPGKSVQMPISVSTPVNQGAGSYYSAIEYEAQTDGGGRVSVAASSATLIFIKVPGEAKELLKLQQFGAYQSDEKGENGSFKSLFFASAPKEMAFRLTNEGNIAEQPNGSIVIKNIFGKQVRVIDQANPKKNLALLGQTRRFQVCMETEKKEVKAEIGDPVQVDVCKPQKFLPGRYTAQLTLLYGENGNNTRDINQTVVFWYLPAWFIVTFIVLLLAIAGGGYWTYRKLTRRSRRRR